MCSPDNKPRPYPYEGRGEFVNMLAKRASKQVVAELGAEKVLVLWNSIETKFLQCCPKRWSQPKTKSFMESWLDCLPFVQVVLRY